ncbi:MAG: phosphotransferase [Myxococcota bacterium]
MPIQSSRVQDDRTLVLWLAPAGKDADLDPFVQRRLTLEACDSDAVVSRLPFARGIYLVHDPAHPGRTADNLGAFVTVALDHNVRVVVVAQNEGDVAMIQKILVRTNIERDARFPPCVELVQETPGWLAPDAEKMARHVAGRAHSRTVDIEGAALEAEDRLLVERAFADCTSVRLESLPGGRSARVYRAHATLGTGGIARTPLPFFVKCDDRRSIRREADHYREFVDALIPFQFRPHLDPERCFLGAIRGVLVGDFVEGAEPLWRCARREGAHHVLFSLFERALRGWRLQAREQRGSLFQALNHCLSGNLSEERMRVASGYGATSSVGALRALIEAIPPLDYLESPTHGDLHVGNVMARDHYAILIDFNSTGWGPAAADPAALEASLICHPDACTSGQGNAWFDVARDLCQREHFVSAPPVRAPSEWEWLWSSIRQIRLYALSNTRSPGEYARVLACYLIRHATRDGDNRDHDTVRGGAFALAERVLSFAWP